eukprot:564952-Rhodomonas_salina.5
MSDPWCIGAGDGIGTVGEQARAASPSTAPASASCYPHPLAEHPGALPFPRTLRLHVATTRRVSWFCLASLERNLKRTLCGAGRTRAFVAAVDLGSTGNNRTTASKLWEKHEHDCSDLPRLTACARRELRLPLQAAADRSEDTNMVFPSVFLSALDPAGVNAGESFVHVTAIVKTSLQASEGDRAVLPSLKRLSRMFGSAYRWSVHWRNPCTHRCSPAPGTTVTHAVTRKRYLATCQSYGSLFVTVARGRTVTRRFPGRNSYCSREEPEPQYPYVHTRAVSSGTKVVTEESRSPPVVRYGPGVTGTVPGHLTVPVTRNRSWRYCCQCTDRYPGTTVTRRGRCPPSLYPGTSTGCRSLGIPNSRSQSVSLRVRVLLHRLALMRNQTQDSESSQTDEACRAATQRQA